MIFPYHDFYSNFTASVKSGDDTMIINMVVNELSDLVVYDTTNLVAAINKVNIKATEKLSDEELIDLILTNLPTNTNLLNAVSFLIAEYNSSINKKGDTAEDSLKVVKNISDGLSSVAKEIGIDKVLRASVKKDIMEQIVTKSTEKGNYNRVIWKPAKSNKKIYVVLGIAAGVAVILFARYQYKKSQQATLALASLGLGANGLPLPPPMPTAPIFTPPVIQPMANPMQVAAPIAPPAPVMSSSPAPMQMPIV